MPDVPSLAYADHAVQQALFPAAAALYAAAALVALLRPSWARPLLIAGVLAHLGATIDRGWAIRFLPVTGKFESFSFFALSTAAVPALAWRPARLYLVPLLGVALAAFGVAMAFPRDGAFPPPLMRTAWYPLHVPMSFLAYGCWTAAAGAALAWAVGRDRQWLALIDRLTLWGFGLWSGGMVCGGVWGVLAWGAFFLWDPKVIWSVILWFHGATFVHLRHTPSLASRTWVRPALAGLGFAWIIVAYVGTSFFFGRSSHAF